MKLKKLTVSGFRGIGTAFELPVGGNNLLVFGENGSSKSTLAKALELLFDLNPNRDLLGHKNFFGTRDPNIVAKFEGKARNTNPQTGEVFLNGKDWPLEWTVGKAKPLPPWLLESAARSAFLDHRKLLLLSDRTRDLSENFFRTAVHHLFANHRASGQTLSELWEKLQEDLAKYQAAQQGKGQEAKTGVTDPVAHYSEIEATVNALNVALDDYLTPPAAQQGGGELRPAIEVEAERLLGYFADMKLKVKLSFDHLSFNRKDGTLSGGRLHPRVTYCTKELVEARGSDWIATHHEFLNEARLTALALALFFAALRLQNRVPYQPGNGEPDEPARLLLMDDVLIGLDYDHRVPVLDIIEEEFVKHGYQVVLLTHNREWFDVCRLRMEESGWAFAEIFARRGRGADQSDVPMRKKTATDLVTRAKEFRDEGELRAAANYARTAVEESLKAICDARRVTGIPFRLDPEHHDTEVFFNAVKELKRVDGGTQLLVPKDTQAGLKALRKTVLNPLSHAHPTTITSVEVGKAIEVAEKLATIARGLGK